MQYKKITADCYFVSYGERRIFLQPRMETRIKKLSQFILYKVCQHIACKVNPASGIRTHDAYRKYFKLKILHAKERILKNISLHKELL